MTYKAVGRLFINYTAPIWSPILHDTNYRKIQYTQRRCYGSPLVVTGCPVSLVYTHKLKCESKGTLITTKYTVFSWMSGSRYCLSLHIVVVCPLQPSSSANRGCPGPENSVPVSS